MKPIINLYICKPRTRWKRHRGIEPKNITCDFPFLYQLINLILHKNISKCFVPIMHYKIFVIKSVQYTEDWNINKQSFLEIKQFFSIRVIYGIVCVSSCKIYWHQSIRLALIAVTMYQVDSISDMRVNDNGSNCNFQSRQIVQNETIFNAFVKT